MHDILITETMKYSNPVFLQDCLWDRENELDSVALC